MIMTVFVVLMCLWLFSGYVSQGGTAPAWGPAANTFIPWVCVAILGFVLFGGGHLPR